MNCSPFYLCCTSMPSKRLVDIILVKYSMGLQGINLTAWFIGDKLKKRFICDKPQMKEENKWEKK